eukprot:5025925-Ditylum_brightwellii.AAC.1
MLMKESIWPYDEINTNYVDLNTGSWWKGAEEERRDMLIQRGIEDQRNNFIALKEREKKTFGLHSDCLELYPSSLAFILEELLVLQSLYCQSGYDHEVFVCGQGN